MKQRRTLEQVKELVDKGDVHSFYVSKEWKEKRLEILERDNYECQRCKGLFTIKDKPIKRIKITKAKYVHHIKPMKEYFSLALQDDNLVSLCFNCHEVVEGRESFSSYKKMKPKVSDEKW